MMIWHPIAVVLIVLHAPGGVEISVAPAQVTSTRDPPLHRPPAGAGHFPAEANCLVGLADGKNIPVIETCETVRHLLETSK